MDGRSSLPSPIQGFLFDLDGTLVDTEHLHHEATNRILAAHGHHLPDADFAPFIGSSELRFWSAMRERFGLPATAAELAARRTQELAALLRRRRLAPLPGARALLERLERAGVPCAVASSSPRDQIGLILERARLERFFAVRRSGHDDVASGKPHPDVYLAAAQGLGVPIEGCVAVEDSATGVEAARAAGAHVIAVPCPSHPDPALGQAHRVVGTLAELDRLVAAVLARRG